MKTKSLKQSVTSIAKGSAKVIGKTARSGTKYAISAGRKIMRIEIPDSLNWIFGFGFKVGIFLLLKSFLILRYQIFNLQVSGFIMITTQSTQALALVGCGALMQNKHLYDDPYKLKKIAQYYGYAFLIGLLVFILRETFDWNFFQEPKAVNWFVDFFAGISKGASEIGLALLFWDCDLWSAFCGLLYFVTITYLHVSFEYKGSVISVLFNKCHLLKESSPAPTITEPVEQDF